MTRAEELSIRTGARVVYRGWEMVVVGTATSLEPGLPRSLELAWPSAPNRIVYYKIRARFCKIVHAMAGAAH